MKHKITRFKNMKIALKEIEPFVQNVTKLRTGRPLKRFGGMRPREVLANWLICAALNGNRNNQFEFTSDPTGGDGVIHDTIIGSTFFTEHTFIPPKVGNGMDAKTIILNAINKKRKKGEVYADNRTLVVFVDADLGMWSPKKVALDLTHPLLFNDVWVITLQQIKQNSDYFYAISYLDTELNCPTYKVYIKNDFRSWKVYRVQ